MSILVTGGAGYIGSVTVDYLRRRGERVVVLDNLSRGHRASLDPEVAFYHGHIGDRRLLGRLAKEHSLESCIHFAALAYVGESVKEPALYFENNVAQGIRLFQGLLDAGVRRCVFSSTCSTYGEPQSIPISESHPQAPTNPYGWSKLFLERILESYDGAYGLKYVALRYFNAAGAIENIGEHHEDETHLIPNVLFAALGRLPSVSVFGDNFPTPDGTCIRDYIHVTDLASAHLLALQYLRDGEKSDAFNLGTGQGYSVMEVIETARKVTQMPIGVEQAPPRPGDPSHLVASVEKAKSVLGWDPQHQNLSTILTTAWRWHQSHPEGYHDPLGSRSGP
jgi:UDP-glucose 4-epimerase